MGAGSRSGLQILAAFVCLAPATGAEIKPVKLVLKSGQALTFSATIADGKVAIGPARLGKFGEAQPSEGEITVGLSPRDKTLYENVVVLEKTAQPIDFLATGFVGGTKIDEIVVHGALGAPISGRIGAMSWTVSLNSFELPPAPTLK